MKTGIPGRKKKLLEKFEDTKSCKLNNTETNLLEYRKRISLRGSVNTVIEMSQIEFDRGKVQQLFDTLHDNVQQFYLKIISLKTNKKLQIPLELSHLREGKISQLLSETYQFRNGTETSIDIILCAKNHQGTELFIARGTMHTEKDTIEDQSGLKKVQLLDQSKEVFASLYFKTRCKEEGGHSGEYPKQSKNLGLEARRRVCTENSVHSDSSSQERGGKSNQSSDISLERAVDLIDEGKNFDLETRMANLLDRKKNRTTIHRQQNQDTQINFDNTYASFYNKGTLPGSQIHQHPTIKFPNAGANGTIEAKCFTDMMEYIQNNSTTLKVSDLEKMRMEIKEEKHRIAYQEGKLKKLYNRWEKKGKALEEEKLNLQQMKEEITMKENNLMKENANLKEQVLLFQQEKAKLENQKSGIYDEMKKIEYSILLLKVEKSVQEKKLNSTLKNLGNLNRRWKQHIPPRPQVNSNIGPEIPLFIRRSQSLGNIITKVSADQKLVTQMDCAELLRAIQEENFRIEQLNARHKKAMDLEKSMMKADENRLPRRTRDETLNHQKSSDSVIRRNEMTILSHGKRDVSEKSRTPRIGNANRQLSNDGGRLLESAGGLDDHFTSGNKGGREKRCGGGKGSNDIMQQRRHQENLAKIQDDSSQICMQTPEGFIRFKTKTSNAEGTNGKSSDCKSLLNIYNRCVTEPHADKHEGKSRSRSIFLKREGGHDSNAGGVAQNLEAKLEKYFNCVATKEKHSKKSDPFSTKFSTNKSQKEDYYETQRPINIYKLQQAIISSDKSFNFSGGTGNGSGGLPGAKQFALTKAATNTSIETNHQPSYSGDLKSKGKLANARSSSLSIYNNYMSQQILSSTAPFRNDLTLESTGGNQAINLHTTNTSSTGLSSNVTTLKSGQLSISSSINGKTTSKSISKVGNSKTGNNPNALAVNNNSGNLMKALKSGKTTFDGYGKNSGDYQGITHEKSKKDSGDLYTEGSVTGPEYKNIKQKFKRKRNDVLNNIIDILPKTGEN